MAREVIITAIMTLTHYMPRLRVVIEDHWINVVSAGQSVSGDSVLISSRFLPFIFHKLSDAFLNLKSSINCIPPLSSLSQLHFHKNNHNLHV